MKPWLREQWCLAPTADPAFVWRMEDVLSVYERPYDATRPVICLDETSRQLLADSRPPLPPAPGRPARRDPEYVRGGVANIFPVEPAFDLALAAVVGGANPVAEDVLVLLAWAGVAAVIAVRRFRWEPAA